jgi:hypothetical protein
LRPWAVTALLAACSSPPTEAPAPAGPLAAVESLYLDLRDLRDRIEVSGSAAPLATRHNQLRRTLVTRLQAVDSAALNGDDSRAFGTIRATLTQDLTPVTDSASHPAAAERRPNCRYDPAAIAAAKNGLDSLRRRIYACYAWAQHHVAVGRDTLDRLSVLGALGRTEDPAERRRLFLALQPVWQSVNGANEPGSPYRRMIALEVRRRTGRETPAVKQARLSGVPPDSLDRWLLAILETWREAAPDSLVEPWDWYFLNGRASRALSGRIPQRRLTQLNAEVYGALGADLRALNVQYDLEPREGKSPVAFCTFGARPRLRNGRWSPGRPSVFATYREGGLDNLAELLHETGHAIHIAAIRTRPAYADWPDSDPFTEALADFVALDVTEPEWQRHWLGDSVPLADGLRARYGGIVLDVAWSLLELELLRDPSADPNGIWTRLTRDYLRIRPHPELSWWAMRGQLVDAPGYMMNYAVGAILIAALRARTTERHGRFVPTDSSWYDWVSPRVFRFGLERPAREVIEDFLGQAVTPAALLADMRRMKR